MRSLWFIYPRIVYLLTVYTYTVYSLYYDEDSYSDGSFDDTTVCMRERERERVNDDT